MSLRIRRTACAAVLVGLAAAAAPKVAAGDEKALVGSYALAKRITADGMHLGPPEVQGFMTFTKTRRTVIMKWNAPDGTPVSIAFIGAYTLSGGKYCESAVYGVQSNLGAPGVSYDTPSATKVCTTAISDAAGLAFEVPAEKLRLSVTRDGMIATTPRWTDQWEKVK
jgi:hypothetical protein